MEIAPLIPAFIATATAVSVAILTFALGRIVRPRARLKFRVWPKFTCKVKIPDKGRKLHRTLNAMRMSLVNDGNDVAHKVEIALSIMPAGINTSPSLNYAIKRSGSSVCILSFESLAAGEKLDLELVSIGGQSIEVYTVRSQNCEGVRLLKPSQLLAA